MSACSQLAGRARLGVDQVQERMRLAYTEPDAEAQRAAARDEARGEADDDGGEKRRPVRLLNVLRSMELAVERRRQDDPEPFDIARRPARPGAPRAASLATCHDATLMSE